MISLQMNNNPEAAVIVAGDFNHIKTGPGGFHDLPPVRKSGGMGYGGMGLKSGASRALLGLRQRSRRVIDYAIEFRTLAADSGWNSPAIKDAFINRLNDDVKDQLAPQEIPAEFEDLVDLDR
ncbi:hypothetical protein L3Q82_003435 [Scortum barcoo]|uniref:Uncharacterized protein n=1 Tax=Scortum barcoo TaxID=214431 RepID=A0ACB8VND6_9TELE|nr:hypothetical protein L3Q82_003435 [Scortum barcoo]